jgi:hypothetical protein
MVVLWTCNSQRGGGAVPLDSSPSAAAVDQLIAFTQRHLIKQAHTMLSRDTASFLLFVGAGSGVLAIAALARSVTRVGWGLGAMLAFSLSLGMALCAQIGMQPRLGPDVALFYEETRTMSAARARGRLLQALQADATANDARLARQQPLMATSLALLVIGVLLLTAGVLGAGFLG